MRVDRPIGIYLVAWPALWALWLAAEDLPSPILICVFLLGAFLMRSAGCVINDFADRNLDGKVDRTKNRPLAKKIISNPEALQLFTLLCMLAALLLIFTNALTIKLSVLAVMLTTIYPFMKRYTHLPQVVLGMAFSCAVPMAFAAQTNSLPLVVWYLFLAVIIWVIAYDTMYAMVDRPDDLIAGIKSTAILFGRFDKFIIGFLQCIFLIIMYYIGLLTNLGQFYNTGLLVTAILFIYQQWLIFNRLPENCFKAFLHNNYVGLAVFSGLVLDINF